MPSLSVDFDKAQLARIERQLTDIKANVGKVLAAAVNDTAKQAKSYVSKGIRNKVNIKKKDIDKYISIRRRASAAWPTATLELTKSKRIQLVYFGGRGGRNGTRFSYKIAKDGGRKTIPNAFVPPTIRGKPNEAGRVFVRIGAKRYPLRVPRGPSPWGVFVKSGMLAPTKQSIQLNLYKNLDRRVKFELLKKAGKVKG